MGGGAGVAKPTGAIRGGDGSVGNAFSDDGASPCRSRKGRTYPDRSGRSGGERSSLVDAPRVGEKADTAAWPLEGAMDSFRARHRCHAHSFGCREGRSRCRINEASRDRVRGAAKNCRSRNLKGGAQALGAFHLPDAPGCNRPQGRGVPEMRHAARSTGRDYAVLPRQGHSGTMLWLQRSAPMPRSSRTNSRTPPSTFGVR